MILENELRAELEAQLQPFASSRQSNSAHGAGLRFQGRILDWVESKLAGGLITPEAKATIKAVALQVFDAFDIPYVGGVIEAAIKKALRPAFENLLDKLLRIDA